MQPALLGMLLRYVTPLLTMSTVEVTNAVKLMSDHTLLVWAMQPKFVPQVVYHDKHYTHTHTHTHCLCYDAPLVCHSTRLRVQVNVASLIVLVSDNIRWLVQALLLEYSLPCKALQFMAFLFAKSVINWVLLWHASLPNQCINMSYP